MIAVTIQSGTSCSAIRHRHEQGLSGASVADGVSLELARGKSAGMDGVVADSASGVLTPGGRGTWLSIAGAGAFLVSVMSIVVSWPATAATVAEEAR